MYVKVWDFGDDPLKIVSPVRIPNKAGQLQVPREFIRALGIVKDDIVEFQISEIHRIKPEVPPEKRVLWREP